MPHALTPICQAHIGSWKNSPLSLSLSGVIRMGSQYESEEVAKFGEQDWFKGLQIIQFQCTESHLCGPYWKMEELIISLDSLSKENTCAYMLLWMGFLTQSDSNLTRVIQSISVIISAVGPPKN